ncbi:MAG: TonB-dependent receptor [Halieaceae bacterium]|nr:TonB-dependent receptor [Halieaceae bacterium]
MTQLLVDTVSRSGLWRCLRGAAIVGLCLFASLLTASVPETTQFAISARKLSPALIQFSQQSGLSIVFSDKITGHYRAPPVTGTLSAAQALEALLEGTELSWELIDDRIIAIYEARCRSTAHPGQECADPEQTLSKYPLFVPGIEETYVYGTRVTGSRIRQTQYRGAAPMDIVSAPDIELSGAQTIGELLKFVPAVSGNAASTAISNGGDGTATVTLRGLPSSNTLVLVNGRRVANNGLAGESVDLNSIPPAAVERIEILKDGASAIYGSDAIAGVVNVILKQDFHGFLAETFYGETGQGDLQTQTQTLQYGTGLPNGSFFISASRYTQDPIFSRDRDVSQSADTRRIGGTDLRSSATPAARFSLPSSGQTLIGEDQDFREATDEDLFNYQAFTSAVVPMERSSIYSNASYDFTEQISGFIDISYVETRAKSTLAPTPIFTAFEQIPLTVSRDNQYNPFGEDIVDVRRRLVEFPTRRQGDESDVARFSATVEGLFAQWNWDAGYSWSRSEARQRTTSIVNANHLQRALGPADQCQGFDIDGCVPVNLLGLPGSITPEQVDYLMVSGEVSGYTKLTSLSGNMSKPIISTPFGRGDLAFGFEYRKEATSKRPDALLASTGTLGATNFEPTRGDSKIVELYAETILPAWRSTSGLSAMDFEGALRYSDYGDFGSSTNPKVGVRLQFNPAWLLRATFATGFRAPSLNELFEGNSEDQSFIEDPCTQPQNVGVLPGCQQLADGTRNQFLTIKGGNPQLEAETAETYGLGVLWTPTALPGMALSADYFQINQHDVIDSSAQFIVNQNALLGKFGSNIQRDEGGNLQLVRAHNINVGRRRVSGADLALTYHHPKRRWGQLSVSSSATYIHEYLSRLDASSPQVDLAGTFRDEASEGLGGIPQWKAQMGIQWSRQRWLGSYELHYVSSLKELIPGTNQTRSIDAWAVHDLQLSYNFDWLGGLRLSAGVDNVFDEAAPLAASAFNDNIDGRTHELKGRYWYSKLSLRMP